MRAVAVRFLIVLVCLAATAACVARLQPAGPIERAPALTADRFIAHDNVSLPLRVWLPDEAPQAVFVALHGFNDYSNAFAAPAAYWRDQGIATYAFDQRGFGATPYRGEWAGAGPMTRDVHDAVALVRARHPGTPVFLLGVSMGGAVAMVAAAGTAGADGSPAVRPAGGAAPPLAVDGLVLVAPAVWGRSTMPLSYRVALWLGAHTLPWSTVSGRGLKISPSDNIEMLRALSADPLVIKKTRIGTIDGLVDLMDDALAASDRVTLPVLVLYGARDEIIPKAPTRRMLADMPTAARTLAVYDGGYHMLLRDLQAEVVHRDIAAWARAPGTALPSGADRNGDALFAEDE
jgi:alpha-beta hydrolase superfamily lysophospholipase